VIRLEDSAGEHFVAPNQIAQISETSAQEQYMGKFSRVRFIDGRMMTCRQKPRELALLVAKMTGADEALGVA